MSWFPRAQSNPEASLRLFCFPYAGGSSRIFYRWQEGLPASVEVVPVELPGRGMRLSQKPFTGLMPMVEAIVEAIGPRLDKPFALFGHSMGALISLELARALRREHGREPAHLFVSGRRAPHLPETSPPMHELPEAEFIERLRGLNGTPPEVFEHEELLQVVLPILRADFSVCETYEFEPGRPLDCPVTAFGGTEDEETPRAQLEAWGELTTRAFALHMLPGDHFFLNTAQQQVLRSVGGALERELAAAP